MIDADPLASFENGVAWYYESDDADSVRHEGAVELYPGWVRLVNPLGISTWVPRERVEQVHER
jgi:hypothetical protein